MARNNLEKDCDNNYFFVKMMLSIYISRNKYNSWNIVVDNLKILVVYVPGPEAQVKQILEGRYVIWYVTAKGISNVLPTC